MRARGWWRTGGGGAHKSYLDNVNVSVLLVLLKKKLECKKKKRTHPLSSSWRVHNMPCDTLHAYKQGKASGQSSAQQCAQAMLSTHI